MNKQLKSYRIYQRFLRNLLIINGCWYMPKKSGKSTYYWSVCVFLSMILYTMLSLHMSYIVRHNMRIMMKFVGIAISGIGATLKVLFSFTINRNSLINYHRMLNDLFEEALMQNEKIQTIIFSSLRKISTLAYTYFAFMTALIFTYSRSSYTYIIHNLFHFHLSTNYTLPLSKGFGWFWTVPDNFIHHLHMIYETGLITLSAMMACGVDCIFGLYVYQFSSTIHSMMFALTNPVSTEKFSDLLRTCAVKHQKLLQCRKTLEHVYGPIVFWHIVSNAVLLCGLMYDLTSLSVFNFDNIFSTIIYVAIKLFQTFIYAWYGTLLTNAGEDFRKGIYFSKWLNSNLDRHVRTNIILMMMQKPMTVNAVFSPIDIIMFTNVSIYYNTVQ
ncbi:Odorant receptor 46a, isoform B [Cyphomyrmex costatus]|uniref:Odorant receptor n=1 Tax=Cyphomyrmex costatus TaxID=456900 RepID=A0A195D4W3_9HYME|nr:Odorant receptor 46a, isoform B [Cyphomyrmex costatus]